MVRRDLTADNSPLFSHPTVFSLTHRFESNTKLANLIAGRLKDLGGQFEPVEPSDVYKMEDTPEKIGQMVRATFKGTDTKKILLIAPMDTVYPRGMLEYVLIESIEPRLYLLARMIMDLSQGKDR